MTATENADTVEIVDLLGNPIDPEPELTEQQADAAFLAHQAEVLEATIDDADKGAFALRRAPGGEPAPIRPAVDQVDHYLRIARVELTMLTLHRHCTVRGTTMPTHPYEDHRLDAEAVVSALFPPAWQVAS